MYEEENKRMGNSEASSSSSSSSSLILTSGASGRISALFSARAFKRLLMLLNAFVMLVVVPFRGKKGKEERVPRRTTALVDHEVAARRLLAIRRVLQDDHRNISVREYSLFVTARGDALFTQSWSPVSVKTRGVVVLLHGLNEHSGRYSDFAKQLNAKGFKVYGMDWIGHGGSDGLHAYVHSLDDAVTDMKTFLEKVVTENPGLPCFCFGHSTGAAIVLKAVLDSKVEVHVAGVVLTSPAIGVQPSHPIFVVLAPVISYLLPRYQVSAANKKGMPVCRDPEALAAKYSDPLVYTGSIRVRTGYEILRITSYLQQNLEIVRVPFLVLHGTADTVTDPEASKKLYEEASSTDKTIKLFQGLLHDLLFEPEQEDIVNEISEWLNCRAQG
ncbi:Hydrolase_4 domain-containing protein [Cephalotus follicularis]|uniref:Hydrolase_4 domain-containing protein n=1 Tax=Cephalotus follicularis TaxID=3775 RepID=A0A1Q3BPS2_CEPFO|nr:Hydrolase_4 domain-containing protein [Cephalotus follicularis]